MKRIADFTLSLLGLLFLLPIILLIAVLIKADSKGNILFCQKRVGLNKKHFTIYKFRTMYTNAPKNLATHLLADSETHITKIGKILRKSSLDELPQLVNILRGDMSIIGPRPALYNQYDLIELRDKYQANSIRPGLSGWAQINGRDEIPIEQKAEFDGFYLQNMGFPLDCLIFFRTILVAIKGEGIR
ncbi:MAG: sugar transferase [Firmicutes bacterium]|nr:sugar transferase [Bacillota bacterium]